MQVLMLEGKVWEDDEESWFMREDDDLLWTEDAGQDAEVQDVEDGGGEGEAEMYSSLAKNFCTICWNWF